MTTYEFLSPDWIDAARALREQYQADAEAPASPIRMNLTVEGVPHGNGLVEAHVDTTNGLVEIDLGHIEPADVKVSLDYDTARAVLIDNNAEAAMGAFMAGKVRVEGDMTRLLAYQSAPPTAAQREVATALKQLTAS
jgi:putative sterol carrier protein